MLSACRIANAATLECVPGIMYVRDRSADSICDTALLFLVMKSEYIPIHFGGSDRTSPVRCVACLYIVISPLAGGSISAYRGMPWWCGGGRSQSSRGVISCSRGCRGPALPTPDPKTKGITNYLGTKPTPFQQNRSLPAAACRSCEVHAQPLPTTRSNNHLFRLPVKTNTLMAPFYQRALSTLERAQLEMVQ